MTRYRTTHRRATNDVLGQALRLLSALVVVLAVVIIVMDVLL